MLFSRLAAYTFAAGAGAVHTVAYPGFTAFTCAWTPFGSVAITFTRFFFHDF